MVMSSLNEIFMDQLGNEVGVRWEALLGKYLKTTCPIFSPRMFTS
jgi:hypothetical protein